MRLSGDGLILARALHGRLCRVARVVGEAIGAHGGAFADHREFYWQQTAPLHRLSPADPLGRALWDEAFREGYDQGVARHQLELQELAPLHDGASHPGT